MAKMALPARALPALDPVTAKMAALVKQGNGVLEEDRFRLNAKGLRFADAAAAGFLR